MSKSHTSQIAAWCQTQFGYAEVGVTRPKSQDFWFNQEHHAVACWLTWGAS
jgi:hypothetical protein